MDSGDISKSTSDWTDSLSSIKISGSILNASISISLFLVSIFRFSIKLATSAGCKSSKVWLINATSLDFILSLKRLI